MTQFLETRRRRDGSIDFDFYRVQAAAARRQMLRNAFQLKATLGLALLTIVMIVCVTFVASAPKYWT